MTPPAQYTLEHEDFVVVDDSLLRDREIRYSHDDSSDDTRRIMGDVAEQALRQYFA